MAWIHDAAQLAITRNDIDRLFDVLAERTPDEIDTGVLLEIAELIGDPDDRQEFATVSTRLIHTLRVENASVSNPQALHERFAGWWASSTAQIIAAAPNVSFAKYIEVVAPSIERARLNAMVENQELLGYFVIPDDPVATTEGAQYITKNLTNRSLQNWYAGVVTKVVQMQRIREEGIASETAKEIQAPVVFDALVLTETGAEERASLADTLSQWAPVGFVYLLWISIFSITQMLLTNTIEEKSNKLVEVLLSSISAVELMAGKIVGIAATGLTIVSVWLSALVLFVVWLPALLGAPAALDLSSLVYNPMYLVSFVVYFLLGYLFYAAVLCGLGSVCNTLKEAQNLVMPVQFLLFVPLIVMIPIGRDPNGTLATVMSWIPPFTPFVMLNRSAFPPSVWTYVFTTLLMVVSIWGALKIAARVFETGILMTGKAPKFRQLAALIRARRTG